MQGIPVTRDSFCQPIKKFPFSDDNQKLWTFFVTLYKKT